MGSRTLRRHVEGLCHTGECRLLSSLEKNRMFEKGVTCMTRREARELAFILLFEMSLPVSRSAPFWKMPLNPGMWRATRSPCPWRKGRRPILKRRIHSSRPFHASGTRTASPVWPCPSCGWRYTRWSMRRISRSASRSTRRSNSPRNTAGGRCPFVNGVLGGVARRGEAVSETEEPKP